MYTEVVLAAVDRPTMLALHPTGACERTVQVACLATKPAHRAASAGPLNLGTDDGSWAVGDGRVLTRSSGVTSLAAVNTPEPAAYATHTELASFYLTRYAELNEMRQRVCVNCNAAPLVCAADATGKSCSWDSTQWAQWAHFASQQHAAAQQHAPSAPHLPPHLQPHLHHAHLHDGFHAGLPPPHAPPQPPHELPFDERAWGLPPSSAPLASRWSFSAGLSAVL